MGDRRRGAGGAGDRLLSDSRLSGSEKLSDQPVHQNEECYDSSVNSPIVSPGGARRPLGPLHSNASSINSSSMPENVRVTDYYQNKG